jgi:hypothetical protein
MRRKALHLAGAVTAAAVLGIGATLTGAAGATAAPTGPVTQTPTTSTPYLSKTVTKQSVQLLQQCGSTMYAVGLFSAVGRGTTTYTRSNVMSFDATTGALTSWAPQANAEVDTITLSPDCSTAYLGGHFTTMNGATAKHIAAVSTSTGALKTGFTYNVNGDVTTSQYTSQGLIIGGKFTKANGVARTALASLDPTTGAVSAYANLAFSGTYPGEPTSKVFRSYLNNTGSRLLIDGVFTSIAGQPRQQIAVLDLGASSVTLDGWYAPEFNGSCVNNESFYAKGAGWSPDGSTIYVAATGYRGSSTLCDSASAFPSTATTVSHKWVNYTGGDSLYAVTADNYDVYIGGHERWANNPNGHDSAGPGALSRPGIGGLDPTTGQATSWNPTRSRGQGVTQMYLTPAGLWIASDNGNDGSSQMCGKKSNKGGICFLPY